MKKQIISSIASIAIITNTIGFSFTANAKVIEPEVVHTETWTGIVKKCAVEENPKSEIDRYQAA